MRPVPRCSHPTIAPCNTLPLSPSPPNLSRTAPSLPVPTSRAAVLHLPPRSQSASSSPSRLARLRISGAAISMSARDGGRRSRFSKTIFHSRSCRQGAKEGGNGLGAGAAPRERLEGRGWSWEGIYGEGAFCRGKTGEVHAIRRHAIRRHRTQRGQAHLEVERVDVLLRSCHNRGDEVTTTLDALHLALQDGMVGFTRRVPDLSAGALRTSPLPEDLRVVRHVRVVHGVPRVLPIDALAPQPYHVDKSIPRALARVGADEEVGVRLRAVDRGRRARCEDKGWGC